MLYRTVPAVMARNMDNVQQDLAECTMRLENLPMQPPIRLFEIVIFVPIIYLILFGTDYPIIMSMLSAGSSIVSIFVRK